MRDPRYGLPRGLRACTVNKTSNRMTATSSMPRNTQLPHHRRCHLACPTPHTHTPTHTHTAKSPEQLLHRFQLRRQAKDGSDGRTGAEPPPPPPKARLRVVREGRAWGTKVDCAPARAKAHGGRDEEARTHDSGMQQGRRTCHGLAQRAGSAGWPSSWSERVHRSKTHAKHISTRCGRRTAAHDARRGTGSWGS